MVLGSRRSEICKCHERYGKGAWDLILVSGYSILDAGYSILDDCCSEAKIPFVGFLCVLACPVGPEDRTGAPLRETFSGWD